MTDDLVIVLDAGSSSIRCHLVGPGSRIASSADRPWSYAADLDAPGLAREFDAEACWVSVREAIGECVGRVADSDDLTAIAVTSQRQSLVFLDEDGGVLYAGPNSDLCAVFQGAAIESEHGSLLYRTTGHRPAFMMAAGKLAWLRERRPDAYSRVANVLTLADWLAYKLSGHMATEPSLASGAGLFDLDSRRPASRMFDSLGLDCPTPPPCDALTPRGAVSTAAVAGLSGLPVVVAGADTQCGLIGLGGADTGSAGIVAGWSATVQILTSEAVRSQDMTTWTGCFQTPGLWTVESSAGDMGSAYGWLADTLFGADGAAYTRMDEAAAWEPVGADGAMAYLGPRAMNVSDVGMQLGGIVFPVPMTLGGPSRGRIVRATLEGFAYALRANLEQAERVSGVTARRVGLGGGMTRSQTLRRLMPSVLGRVVEVGPEPDATVTGAARLALTALGRFGSLDEAASRARLDMEVMEPDPQAAAEYDDLYQAWQDTQDRIGKLLR